MAAICRFCGQEFGSGQAVKAHLKACAAYKARPQANPVPEGNASGKGMPLGTTAEATGRITGGTEAGEFDPVRQLEKQVAAGRLRLTMREIDEAHADLDRKAEAKERERKRETERDTGASRRAAKEREAARVREERARLERERLEDTRQRCRDRIQAAKQAVMREPVAKRFGLPDVTTQVLRAIEHAFSDLPIDELPDGELAAIARDARDRIYRKAEAAFQEAEAEKREAQMRARKLAERKQRLIGQGIEFAKRELEAVDDLSAVERLSIQLRVESELQEITGEEDWAEIEDIIYDIFDADGIL